MNKLINDLSTLSTIIKYDADNKCDNITFDKEKFAKLIIQECEKLNHYQSYELLGVIADVEDGNGFDNVCLNTIKQVQLYLAKNTLAKHFGVEELNVKIEDLARKAGIGIYPLSFTAEKEKYFNGDSVQLLYQFANLILQECVKVVEKSKIIDQNSIPDYGQILDNIVINMQQHFKNE